MMYRLAQSSFFQACSFPIFVRIFTFFLLKPVQANRILVGLPNNLQIESGSKFARVRGFEDERNG